MLYPPYVNPDVRVYIAVRGDVLRDIELLKRVDMVMKDGVLYKENGPIIEARFK